jgi:hypothetical protein
MDKLKIDCSNCIMPTIHCKVSCDDKEIRDLLFTYIAYIKYFFKEDNHGQKRMP